MLPAPDIFVYGSIAAALTLLALALALPRLLARRAVGPGNARGATIALIATAVTLAMLGVGLRALPVDSASRDGGPAGASAAAAAPVAVPVQREDLLRHVGRNPGDARAWVLLARMDFEADRFDEAAAAYQKALAASPKVAADPLVWCEYADALGMAQGGSLTGKPRELVMRALSLAPAHPRALEMAGSAAYDERDFAATLTYWRQLLGQLPEHSAQHRELATAIARVERLTLATGASQGPSQ